MNMSNIQWLFDITRNPIVHAFTDVRITTPSLCKHYKTAHGGPWALEKEGHTKRCVECLRILKEQKEDK